MGNVQGDKKLNTPAMNANRVRATIPESGRLGLGWKGFSGADFETVDSVAVEEREGLVIVGEETELFRTFRFSDFGMRLQKLDLGAFTSESLFYESECSTATAVVYEI